MHNCSWNLKWKVFQKQEASAGFPRQSTQDTKTFHSLVSSSMQWCQQCNRWGDVDSSSPASFIHCVHPPQQERDQVCRTQEMFVSWLRTVLLPALWFHSLSLVYNFFKMAAANVLPDLTFIPYAYHLPHCNINQQEKGHPIWGQWKYCSSSSA